jgi:hypothetical protein
MKLPSAEAEERADRLSRLTGEPIEVAVTAALRERLAQEEARRRRIADFVRKAEAVAADIRQNYDTSPVTQAEWDEAGG